MNGELGELLEQIKKWSKEIHEQRHKENLTKFDKIFNKLDCLITLKTDVRWLTWGVRLLWGVIIVMGLLLRGAVLFK